ncbi:MAG: GHMP family kinase ATP-binding protein [Thermoplasmatota archaeon]
MNATAFAPGHVSGLFAIHADASDPLARGSRGAGWSVDRGAMATATRADRTRIRSPAPSETTAAALRRLGVQVAVELTLELPVGQGFGMSAAGSLAACLAACSVGGLDPELALEATHQAEVEMGTGLGDAIGAWVGGAEVRLKPGLPPHGWAKQVALPTDALLYCTVGGPIATRDVVARPQWRQRTRILGDEAVDRILARGRADAWPAILAESARFTRELGLLTPAMEAAARVLPPGLAWGQCMLGTTLWVAGPGPLLKEAEGGLARHGATWRMGFDALGARLVPPASPPRRS